MDRRLPATGRSTEVWSITDSETTLKGLEQVGRNVQPEDDQDKLCGICYEEKPPGDFVTLDCLHEFCGECYTKHTTVWRRERHQYQLQEAHNPNSITPLGCPFCRLDISPRSLLRPTEAQMRAQVTWTTEQLTNLQQGKISKAALDASGLKHVMFPSRVKHLAFEKLKMRVHLQYLCWSGGPSGMAHKWFKWGANERTGDITGGSMFGVCLFVITAGSGESQLTVTPAADIIVRETRGW